MPSESSILFRMFLALVPHKTDKPHEQERRGSDKVSGQTQKYRGNVILKDSSSLRTDNTQCCTFRTRDRNLKDENLFHIRLLRLRLIVDPVWRQSILTTAAVLLKRYIHV